NRAECACFCGRSLSARNDVRGWGRPCVPSRTRLRTVSMTPGTRDDSYGMARGNFLFGMERSTSRLGDNIRMRRQLAFLGVGSLLLVIRRTPPARAWVPHPLALSTPDRSQGSVLSPHERTDGQVDGASPSIVYGRPSMRGRTIFGGLVPYGRVWCPGADQCTTLSTDRDLQFA